MAHRWFNLLLGVVLLQGALTFSPIEVPDEEWIAYRNMMRDPAYRLPTTTEPINYAVSLTPYFDTPPTGVTPFTFDGAVTIRIQATQANVNQIVLHCNDLTIQSLTVALASAPTVDLATPNQAFTCEMPWSFLRISTVSALDPAQEYIISSTFRGNLQTNMRGFYRSWYVDNTGRKWMATTQFQPGHARQAFPCYDEPGFKATFDITINREAGFSATISNMPIRTETTLTNGRISETFHTTPKTSTYLLAFIVSHYSQVATNGNAVRPFHIYARNNAANTGDFALEIGEKLLLAMEEYTAYPYYTVAPNMNMKQAAIPDFSAGAMENWGLLTYREALILNHPENTNNFYRQRIANIISHEIAHMWFGNLVTCAWWDNLWLNEGFARFYQYYLTDMVATDMGFPTRFIVEQVQVSLLSDSIDSAHALTNPNVNDPTTVSAHFSTITYAKGASILRMTQHLLGESTYLKGLRSYLRDNEFDVAEPEDLFTALDNAATEDNALSAYGGITIDRYFKSWSEKGGHPVLNINVDHETGRITATQERFERTTGVSASNSLWDIPITWTRGGSPDFENLKPSQILTATSTQIDRGSIGREWVIFNKQQSGFYRVNYDQLTWALITQALRGEGRTAIHEYNRAQIVDDVFLLARAGKLPYSRAFNILSFLNTEDQYAPWIAAITGYNFALRRLAHDSTALQRLRDQINDVSTAIVARLGFNEGGTFMDNLLRMHVMTFLCDNGHEACITAARTSFQSWINGGTIPANMRPWVYCTGLRHGTAADFNVFWTRYLAEDLANEKVVMIAAAGCTGDQASLNRYLDAIVAGDDAIRPQDYSAALNSAITSNEENTLRAFEWLKNNIAQTATTLGSIITPLSTITSRLLNEQQIAEVQTWLDANTAIIGQSAYNTGVAGIATSRANIQWYGQRASEFDSYFETGYVDETVDPTPEITPAPPTEAPVTDSANIAALSIVTLIMTLVINMA